MLPSLRGPVPRAARPVGASLPLGLAGGRLLSLRGHLGRSTTSSRPASDWARMATNGDFGQEVAVSTSEMAWQSSPSPGVHRKRVYHDGPAEAGKVTSVVRYDAGSTFPVHYHPDGEEILVLEGVFSDESGDYPKGTFLLNPEGFRHAPFSHPGCVLFVKLRQFPGLDRQHVVLQTKDMEWVAGCAEGVEAKMLYEQEGYPEGIWLEKWAPGSEVDRGFEHGAELFVVEGDVEGDGGSLGKGAWLRFPVGSRASLRTVGGCEVYLRTGGHGFN